VMPRPATLFIWITFLSGGCAADKISGPAKTIGDEVGTFQGALSSFQDDLNGIQDDERATITGTATRGDTAIAVTKELQVEWVTARAKSETDIFTALQNQGKDELTRLLAQATQPTLPASVTFPIDKLGAVAKTMDQLAKAPGTMADLEFVVSYGSSVNTQLKAIEDKAKPTTSAAGSAPAPAK
jgi:hypothetical protein